MSEAGKRWCRRAASTEPNKYEAAELLYMFFGDKQPYSWKHIKEHRRLFKEA